LPLILTILSFITLFLAIFVPCVVVISKREESRHSDAWSGAEQPFARSGSDAAWILSQRKTSN